MACKNCVFVTEGCPCPECGEISTPNLSLQYVRTQERLYGTSYGKGRYNEGLGERTYGKQDFDRKVEAKGLRLLEPGESALSGNGKQERERAQRKETERHVANVMKGMAL